MNQTDPPQVSIVIPAYNAESTISRCLDSVFRQAGPEVEVIVIDDCSRDGTRECASKYDVRLRTMAENSGPSVARNYGARAARAELLFFIDADVTLCEGALARAVADMRVPGVDAVIGSYDDDPLVRTTVSLFKNLAHHYFHQHSGPGATTFWGACGLIRRELFFSLGGFDEKLPGITDVELGYRLISRGGLIRLDPGLQVKHLKHWTLPLLVRTDIQLRALPWTTLLVEYGYLPKRLNFGSDQRAGALLAIGLVVFGVMALFRPLAAVPFVACLALAALVNQGLLRLFYRKGGVRLLVGGILLQNLYYLYSAWALIVGVTIAAFRRALKAVRDG
jgi:glycosyltransferase involved in cell wall biosynthesis